MKNVCDPAGKEKEVFPSRSVYAFGIGSEEKIRALLEGQRRKPIPLRASFSPAPSSLQKDVLLLLGGGIGYGLMEVIWRGRTHWSMVLCGGLCLLAITKINARLRRQNLFLRALLCTAFITFVEFTAGCVLNLWLGLRVWNYSAMYGQLLGQICPLYSFFWFLISTVLCFCHSLFCRNSLFGCESKQAKSDS